VLDKSAPDSHIVSKHFYYDVLVNNQTLVTMIKDEGATNSFMSKGLADAIGMEPFTKVLSKGETENFRGMSGTTI
jgi:hypothetical protein